MSNKKSGSRIATSTPIAPQILRASILALYHRTIGLGKKHGDVRPEVYQTVVDYRRHVWRFTNVVAHTLT